MTNKNGKILAPIKQRVIQIIENQVDNKKKFFEKYNFSSSNFRGEALFSEVSAEIVAKILSIFPETDANWLLTGNKIKKEVISVNESRPSYKQSPIPLVNVRAIGGFGNNSFSIEERDVKDYYVIPKFKHKKVDFMIEVEGSSMYPKYNSGDVVACNIINENSFIQWNKTHVIATKEQGIIIKRIKKGSSDHTLCMISDNKDYDPFEVSKDDITGIALVVGVIRLE